LTALLPTLIFITASSAFGQVDSFSLRAKYGAPLERETFTVRSGIEMVVDYGANKQTCQIWLPVTDETTKEQMDRIVDEVVPPAVRGKEVTRMLRVIGGSKLTMVMYEHVTVSETNADVRGPGITIRFLDTPCPAR
jgi:hypothetical protein